MNILKKEDILVKIISINNLFLDSRRYEAFADWIESAFDYREALETLSICVDSEEGINALMNYWFSLESSYAKELIRNN